MRKSTRLHLIIPLFSIIVLGIPAGSIGQEMASNNNNHFFASVRQHTQNENMLISLKDAVNQLKYFYKVKVAYKEGLLDSKIVPASITGSFKNMDAETALKQLFSNTSLSYKKIGENQFSVFETHANNVPKVTENNAFTFALTGRVSASKDGSGLPNATAVSYTHLTLPTIYSV